MNIRAAAVAGHFYPDDPQILNNQLDELLQTQAEMDADVQPKALIVPHAGYIYSGRTAALAYQRLAPFKDRIKKVTLLGLSHRVAFHGIAATSADEFASPLGNIVIDRATIARLQKQKLIIEFDAAHRWEHSLEVQLPFLQRVLNPFALIPLATGDCSVEEVAACLRELWGDESMLVVISSDLSHFHPYHEAQRLDRDTCKRVLQKDTQLEAEQACGYHGINGLLHFIRERDFRVECIDYCNSGDTAGDRQRVVGYGAFAIYPNGL